MGWWGEGIVDGDDPSDMICEIEMEAGIIDSDCELIRPLELIGTFGGELTEEQQKIQFAYHRDLIKKMGWQAMLKTAGAEVDDVDDEDAVTAFHVVGYLHLAYQIDIPEDFKPLLLKTIDDSIGDVPNEGWRDPDARLANLRQFRECVEKNNGGGLSTSTLFAQGELLDRTMFD